MENLGASERRIKCIDALRGIIIALMLVAENPGSSSVYLELRHAAWNGLTVTDLVFALFIFISGVMIPHSIQRRKEKGESNLRIALHIVYRSAGIFLIGLFLNGFPNFDFTSIRILGVLQRIGITYLAAGFIVLFSGLWGQAIGSLVLLTVYCILLKSVYVPGFGRGILAQNGNAVQYIDMLFLKSHMYTPTWDPEGILSTIPAISSALFGTLAGKCLFLKDEKRLKKLGCLIVYGTVSIVTGIFVSRWFPVNKNLWSASYVLVTAGIGEIAIGILYGLIDMIGYSGLIKPFMILGSNAIFVYVCSELVSKTLWREKIYDTLTGGLISLNYWLCSHWFTDWAGKSNDSLYFSVAYLLIWMGITYKLYRRRIFFKV